MWKRIYEIGLMFFLLGLSMIGGIKIKLLIDGQKQALIKERFLEKYEKIAEEINAQNGGECIASISSYTPIIGNTIAIIDIPDIDLNVSVVEGVEKKDIKLNIGHYPQSDMPWIKGGNFCVAGHSSVVYNCLFNDLHHAKEGMDVIVTTQYGTYYYTITDIFVVEPTETYVLNRSDEGKNLITMTTCYNSGKQRLIVVGEMKPESLQLVNMVDEQLKNAQ